MALTDQQQQELYNNICGGQQHALARVFADILLDRPVTEKGRFNGSSTSLRAMLGWNGENVEGTRDLIRAISTANTANVDVAELGEALAANLGPERAAELARALSA